MPPSLVCLPVFDDTVSLTVVVAPALALVVSVFVTVCRLGLLAAGGLAVEVVLELVLLSATTGAISCV